MKGVNNKAGTKSKTKSIWAQQNQLILILILFEQNQKQNHFSWNAAWTGIDHNFRCRTPFLTIRVPFESPESQLSNGTKIIKNEYNHRHL